MKAYKVVRIADGGVPGAPHRYSSIIAGGFQKRYMPGVNVRFGRALGTAFEKLGDAESWAYTAHSINVNRAPPTYMGIEVWEVDVDSEGRIESMLPYRQLMGRGRFSLIGEAALIEWWKTEDWRKTPSQGSYAEITTCVPLGSIACSRIQLMKKLIIFTVDDEKFYSTQWMQGD